MNAGRAEIYNGGRKRDINDNCVQNNINNYYQGSLSGDSEHWRKRSFSQAFVPSSSVDVQKRYSGSFNDKGMSPLNEPAELGGVPSGMNSNANSGVAGVHMGNLSYCNSQMDHQHLLHNQYIYNMMTPPPHVNGGMMGIHGAVPFTRMPPPTTTPTNYRDDIPVGIRSQQPNQLLSHLRSDSSNASINNPMQPSVNSQCMNTPLGHSDIFAMSLNQVLYPPVLQPPPQEFPPPVILLSHPEPSREQTSSIMRAKTKPQELPKPTTASKILIGKRRGGKVLPTGVIKRLDGQSVGNRQIATKLGKDGPVSPSTAWSRYMAEVERYRKQSCSDETPNRSLVK